MQSKVAFIENLYDHPFSHLATQRSKSQEESKDEMLNELKKGMDETLQQLVKKHKK